MSWVSGQAYSDDLRARVLAAVDRGGRVRIPMMTPTYSEQSTPMRSDNSTPTILRCAGGVDKSPARGLGQAG